MTTIDIPLLRELASKATPGPWRTDADVSPDDVTIWSGPKGDDAVFLGNVGEWACKPVGLVFDADAHNGRFIAAANPAAVLALLEELEKARECIEAIRKARIECLFVGGGSLESWSPEKIRAALAAYDAVVAGEEKQ